MLSLARRAWGVLRCLWATSAIRGAGVKRYCESGTLPCEFVWVALWSL
jgi:hypothetical protein